MRTIVAAALICVSLLGPVAAGFSSTGTRQSAQSARPGTKPKAAKVRAPRPTAVKNATRGRRKRHPSRPALPVAHAPGQQGVETTAPAAPQSVVELDGPEAQLAAAINGARTAAGLRPLTIDATLEAAARDHTAELFRDGLFTHDFAKDGSSYGFGTWIRWYYPGGCAGENLVAATPDLDANDAVQLWLNSPDHRENLLSPSYRVMGVELAYLNGRWIGTNTFGGCG